MSKLQVFRPSDTAWPEALNRSIQYDFYHLPAYHVLAERRGEGEAYLYSYTSGEYLIGLPLLVRPVREVRGLETSPWQDAGSVYGYPGPVASHEALPANFVGEFHGALEEYLRRQDIVTAFSRLHPLLPQRHLLDGLGRVERVGVTVSVDLTLPDEEQRSRYRNNHRRDIRKLLSMGSKSLSDGSLKYMQSFIEIYLETMERVDADRKYIFDTLYFDYLLDILGESLHLYVCKLGSKVTCAGIFVETNRIVQYHLGGTSNDYLKIAPMKLLFDAVRADFTRRGAKVFHLGGGLGGAVDSLFHFKSGFGTGRHDFCVWKWIVDPGRYEELCHRAEEAATESSGAGSPGYFPAYRG